MSSLFATKCFRLPRQTPAIVASGNSCVSAGLHAGVMAEGLVHYEPAGTPQGAVLSPLGSNLYLHEVFDRWLAEVVQERMAGKVFAVR